MPTTEKDDTITVQYMPCGHSDWSRDPEHIRLDKERAARGFLDALILPSNECEECQEENRRQRQLYYDYDMD